MEICNKLIHLPATIQEETMTPAKFLIGTVASLVLFTAAFAQGQYGTAAEAKAMLEKAVAAVKADKEKALAMFNKGEGGFKDRDLQPFCFNVTDGKILRRPFPISLARISER
jgi:hypothetical protein